jgi:hypothetical protein
MAVRLRAREANAGLVAQGVVGKDSAFPNGLEEGEHFTINSNPYRPPKRPEDHLGIV